MNESIAESQDLLFENQNQLIRAVQTVGSLVLPLEDEERILDVLVEQIIETAQIRSLVLALVYQDRGYLELVRNVLYNNLNDKQHITPMSTLHLERLRNRRYDLLHPTAICRAITDHPLIIVDGNDPKLAKDPDYNPKVWKNKVAYFTRLMYRDECVGMLAGACALEDEPIALEWEHRIHPLLDVIASTIKTLRLLHSQRFLAYQPPPEVRLSDREKEVLRRITLGESSTDIADIMRLSPRTVHSYRRRICNKLNRHTQADLTRYAIMTGLIPLTD